MTVESIKETEEVIEDEQKEETSKDAATVTEEVMDEICSNQEYFNSGSKGDESEKETVSYELECWDPDNKRFVQDIYNHMGESLEQMFCVFDVKPEDQQYQLDVLEKVGETFKLNLEMKIFENNE